MELLAHDQYLQDELSPKQIEYLDRLTDSYRGLEAHGDSATSGEVDHFNNTAQEQLEGMGLDLSDPRIRFPIVVDALLCLISSIRQVI